MISSASFEFFGGSSDKFPVLHRGDPHSPPQFPAFSGNPSTFCRILHFTSPYSPFQNRIVFVLPFTDSKFVTFSAAV